MKAYFSRWRIALALLTAAGAAFSSVYFVPTVSAENAQAKSGPSLSDEMIGTWILVGKPGQVGEPPKSGGMLKFITGKHWCITQADASGKVLFHHGGTYSLDGDKYVETIEYANESTITMLRQKLTFSIKVEGVTYTQTGIGNDYTQVWKKLK